MYVERKLKKKGMTRKEMSTRVKGSSNITQGTSCSREEKRKGCI